MRFENFPPDRYLRGNERIDLYPTFICKKGRERKEGELELRSVLGYAERVNLWSWEYSLGGDDRGRGRCLRIPRSRSKWNERNIDSPLPSK